MQIVQLEEQKLSWKDYWCFAKIIWENDNTKGMFLLVFALGLESVIKFEKESAIYLGIFVLALAGIGLTYMWPYLYYTWKYHAAVKEANRRIREGQGMVLTFEEEKCTLSFRGNDKQNFRLYDDLVVFELKNYYYVNLPAIIKKDSLEGKEFRKLLIEEDIRRSSV